MAGLNHAAHVLQEIYKIDKWLDDADINPRTKPKMEQSSINKVLKVKQLALMHKEGGNAPVSIDLETNDPLHGGVYSNETHTIKIYKSAFISNYRRLALVIGHELRHSIDGFSGDFNAKVVEFGSYKKAKYWTEYNAYKWQFDNGRNYIFGTYDNMILNGKKSGMIK